MHMLCAARPSKCFVVIARAPGSQPFADLGASSTSQAIRTYTYDINMSCDTS